MNNSDLPEADELVRIVDDLAGLSSPVGAVQPSTWQILIVDDEAPVHEATVFALEGLQVLGGQLAFLHAHDAGEAIAVLERHPDVAVILLDVVMEHEDSGLQLVRHVREVLGLRAVRIILHTGQAGYAPETQVVQAYDINDYKMKSELTRTSYITTIIAAIRSYDQIRTIESGNRALEQIIAGASDLFARRGTQELCQGVLEHVLSLPGAATDAAVILPAHALPGDSRDPALRLVAVAGLHAELAGQPLASLSDEPMVAVITQAAALNQHQFSADAVTLVMRDSTRTPLFVHFRTTRTIRPFEQKLFEIFAANAAVAFENARLVDRLQVHAYVDQLTGLANRSRFVNLIDERLLLGRSGWAVAIIDIVRFSETNDSLGHANGDQLLKAIGHQLGQSLGDQVTLARIAGDCFGLLGPESALQPLQLRAILGRPFRLGAYALQVATTIGLVRLAHSEGSGLDAIKDANIALNEAKSRRLGYCYHNEHIEAATQERMRLAYGLQNGLRCQELEVHYQPQVDLGSGAFLGAEALLRWRTADGKWIPPSVFIPVAESSGLIHPIGEFVLRTVAQQLQAWCMRGLTHFRMAINVSVDQFRAPDFIARVTSVIDEFHLDARMLELEITESIAMGADLDTVLRTLRALKALGLSVSIDDFGTGYSSLGTLPQLPIDRLKIDRGFVQGLGPLPAGGPAGAGAANATIAAMIVRMGQEFGLEVLAEGVETEGEAAALRALGCSQAQGYLFGRPVPANSFAELPGMRALLDQPPPA